MLIEIKKIEKALSKMIAFNLSKGHSSAASSRKISTLSSFSNAESKASIIDYWHSIELFTPALVQRIVKNNEFEVFNLVERGPLPWEPSHPLQKRILPKGKSWRFHVYGGLYLDDVMKEILENIFGKDPEITDGSSKNERCVLTFCLSQEGIYIPDSFVLSTSAWALGRTIRLGPQSPVWLEGFEKDQSLMADLLHNNLFIHDKPFKYGSIVREIKRVCDALSIGSYFPLVKIRVKAFLVKDEIPRELKLEEEPIEKEPKELLNSFFLDDLNKLIQEVEIGNFGAGLKKFLLNSSELDLEKRIDIRKSPQLMFDLLAPNDFPRGRWPSKGHYPLILSQQLAINLIHKTLSREPGLFSINGPPGTGKTTLLRDLIADVIVERALILSTLPFPKDAFVGQKNLESAQAKHQIALWKEDLKGFEIVVASCTNGAVENISLEIPGIDAVDSSWLNGIDYFTEFGTRLLGKDAWALIAARLGNKLNCIDLERKFWNPQKDKDGKTIPGFSNYLRLRKKVNWKEAVTSFNQALAEEESIRKDLSSIRESFFTQSGLEKEIEKLKKEKQEKLDEKVNIEEQLHSSEEKLVEEQELLIQSQKSRLLHRRFFPSSFEIVLTLGKAYKSWWKKDAKYQIESSKLDKSIDQNQKIIIVLKKQLSSLDRDLDQLSAILEQKCTDRSNIHDRLVKARHEYGGNLPHFEDWYQDEEKTELSSPWAVPQWVKARAKVFIEALKLHRAFIDANSEIFRKNLICMIDFLSGSIAIAPSEVVEAAWTTLFFVIPVISTTFASFTRLFAQHRKETLGWLLIDEAGQATPQMAAGAIWRAKRTVMFGDPMQLEPVVTIPFTAQHALRDYHHVANTWVPGTTSVQLLADRVSPYGTYLSYGDAPFWVSLPLRVHRRCDRLMFEICNTISYAGMMVFGTPFIRKDWPDSQWIDVVSQSAEDHWIPAEGEAASKLITDLISYGVEREKIFLISPFKAVVSHLKSLAGSSEKDQDQNSHKIQVGTIHTVQGKEADVVILVLGGNPSKIGAKKWVSSKPNLLNVAVSRAKKRIYVIGNWHEWSKYQYFDELCHALEFR